MSSWEGEPMNPDGVTGTQTYPQAPRLTDAELQELLATAEIARIATANEDGTVHVAPMWFRYDDPDILLGTQAVTRKVRNVERDPQVTVLVDVTTPTFVGAIMYGRAYLERQDAVSRRADIFRRFMDRDAAQGFAAQLAAKWEPVIIRFHPERVVTFDYRKGFPV
jgi:predicted pyridoxine 5'-phosphate oxidase superfamily flavin-nucleotide-binding protein